ncbi:hypothetical protein RP20_CCG015653 [Aedes albopictus]|nr:hypothetical protein RP20_CCG015653 [Aedes albopictus]
MDPLLAFLKLLRTSLLVQLRETFAQSTLHGVRFITERGRPFWERFCWFCMVSISTVTTLIIIFNLWERFQTKPTITGPDTGSRNNWTIFPTVLVCPMDVLEVVRGEKVMALLDPLANYTEVEPMVEALAGISYWNMVTLEDVGFLDGKVKNVRSFVFYVGAACADVLSKCWFRGMEMDCCSQFRAVFSEVGFCYGFNAKFYDTMAQWERSTDLNYLYETDKKWGLTIQPSRPSNIYLHSHNEISGLEFQPLTQWEDGFGIGILISMKETYTTEDARQLSVGQRKCIFPNEVKPKYYRDDYTFSGCMKECRMQKCLKYCRCIPPFYAPTVSLPFCTVKQLTCLDKYKANITSIRGCQDCELACHNMVFDVEKYSKSVTNVTKDEVVTIEYLTWPIIRYKREVLFGWVDLLVSFGGIAGLFLGFSLLSGVEIVYFFTMRAWCMLYKNRDELVAIEQQKLKQSQNRYDLSIKAGLRHRIRPKLSALARSPLESQPEDATKRSFNSRHVITVGLIEQDFEAVKVPNNRGLILAEPTKRYISRSDRIANLARPNQFRSNLKVPYSEENSNGMLYNGYLP